MIYGSTRSENKDVKSSEAIIKGIAHDGGLYIPLNIPKIDRELGELKELDYKELAFYILKKYLTDFDDQELIDCINSAYDDKFDNYDIVPVENRGTVNFMELYHGPTLAFKDMALTILPHFMKTAAKKLDINKEIVILTATSGDTGKAALEGFANVTGVRIIVFYPKDGVSEIQKRQMITQKGENTHVIGIDGNFDDAQNAVKEIFGDRDFNNRLNDKGYIFSSANSINIGRLVPQIVYYIYGYLNLLNKNEIKEKEKINIVVPTGNFGNILAAYYAKMMGLPINKLICASNENKILTDFLNTGIYDINREFKTTVSPSMDILISSNLERLLYHISMNDYDKIKSFMEDLKNNGVYEVDESIKYNLKDFYGAFATEQETYETIKNVYEELSYVIDPHAAVAYNVYKKYIKQTEDNNTKTLIASTASPFKFTRTVYTAIDGKSDYDDFRLIDMLAEKTSIDVPKSILELKKKDILHKNTCKRNNIKNTVEKILGL